MFYDANSNKSSLLTLLTNKITYWRNLLKQPPDPDVASCFTVINARLRKPYFHFRRAYRKTCITAQSPILNTTNTLKRLAKRGYLSMLDYYLKVSPQFNEPLYT